MNAIRSRCETLLDRFAGDLTDAAYPVALRHGIRATSVDVEVEVGRAVEGALRRARRGREAGKVSRPVREEVLAEVTDAVYRVALAHGFAGAFLDMELDLWAALDRVGRTARSAAALYCTFAPGARRGAPAMA